MTRNRILLAGLTAVGGLCVVASVVLLAGVAWGLLVFGVLAMVCGLFWNVA